MNYTASTKRHQQAVAMYTRTGMEISIPGTKRQGLARYRQMIFSIVNDSLSSAYPLTRQLLTDEEWDQCVDRFFASHACRSPFLWKMPLEFYEYADTYEKELTEQFPFFSELLLFEWLEIELFMKEDSEIMYQLNGKLEHDKLVLNPAVAINYFQYPVYKIRAKEISDDHKDHYFLISYRTPVELNVKFMGVIAPFARMIELLSEEVRSMNVLIEIISDEFKLPITEEMIYSTRMFMQQCFQKGIILGYLV